VADRGAVIFSSENKAKFNLGHVGLIPSSHPMNTTSSYPHD